VTPGVATTTSTVAVSRGDTSAWTSRACWNVIRGGVRSLISEAVERHHAALVSTGARIVSGEQTEVHRLVLGPSGTWPEGMIVVDFGAAGADGSYRECFASPRVWYIGPDLQAGPGVDLVAEDPDRVPLPSAPADVVLSGQPLEPSEFFWSAFREMARVLKPNGFLFLIVPDLPRPGPLEPGPPRRLHPSRACAPRARQRPAAGGSRAPGCLAGAVGTAGPSASESGESGSGR
jgi:SAM-dependent methyltransferase